MMTSLMTAPLAPVTAINARLVGRLTRTYDRAIRAEENAVTLPQAYRLATVSERCLRDLQAAQAGLPLPERKVPRTARNLAKQGLAALATIGRVIARALRTEAALRKAQAAATLARVARKAARLVRQALRATVRAVARRALLIASIFVVTVTPTKESSMNVPQLAARIHAGQGHNCCQVSVDGFDGNATDSPDGGDGLLAYTDRSVGLAMHVELRGDRFVFTGGLFGEHSLAAQGEITSAARLLAHWNGYVATNVERATGGAS
jgi:hypothetical protein